MRSPRDTLVELRQYTLHRHRRDALIELFEREFIEAQDAAGAHVLGLFRDLDDPQRFVWLRGFASMAIRFDALTAFYGGPVWQAHRSAANPTMRDAANVLLLRPAFERTNVGSAKTPGAYLALIHDLGNSGADDFCAQFEAVAGPIIAAAGGMMTSCFVTTSEADTFERLPVRTDARVHLCFVRFEDVDALDVGLRRIGHLPALRDAAPDDWLPAFSRKPEVLRLAPTTRSRWR